jgi:Domain of unknown function (DUF4411)
MEMNRSYPLPAFASLWDNLGQLADEGRLISSQEVLRDLEKKEGDVVHNWAKSHESMFLPLTEQVQKLVTEIMATFERLVDARSGKSMSDPFVIATAAVEDCVVVTEEGPGTDLRPKIPHVCAARKMKCIQLRNLIIDEGWRFTRPPSA